MKLSIFKWTWVILESIHEARLYFTSMALTFSPWQVENSLIKRCFLEHPKRQYLHLVLGCLSGLHGRAWEAYAGATAWSTPFHSTQHFQQQTDAFQSFYCRLKFCIHLRKKAGGYTSFPRFPDFSMLKVVCTCGMEDNRYMMIVNYGQALQVDRLGIFIKLVHN